MSHKIKRGVSLYSFQNETFLRTMSLEDCIRTCAEIGAKGIEVVGEQTFSGWPEVGMPEQEIAHWHGLMERYGTTPVCHDFMLDYKRYKGRLMRAFGISTSRTRWLSIHWTSTARPMPSGRCCRPAASAASSAGSASWARAWWTGPR